MKRFYKFLMLLAALAVPWVTQAQGTAITTFPFTCDFETASDNAYWSFTNAANGWYIGTATNNGGTNALYVSENNGTTSSYSGSACVSYAYLTLDIAAAGQYAVQFDWKCNGESTYDFLRVAVASSTTTLTTSYSDWTSTSVPSGFTAIDGGSKLNLSSSWQTKNTVVSFASAGTYRLIFVWRNDGSVYNQPPAAIDNVIVTELTCPQPTALSAIPSADELELSWTAGGSESEWKVVISDSIETYVYDTSYTATNLEDNTPYTVKVYAICGAGDTSLATIGQFRTSCVPISSLPYSNDFEDDPAYASGVTPYADAFPNCWTRINDATGTYNYYPYITTTANYVHSGVHGMYWYQTSTSGYAQNEYAILPPVDLDVYDISDLTLAFYAKTTSTSYHPQPIIGVMTNPTDASTFEPVRTLSATDITTDWQMFDVSFANYTGTGAYIAIKWPRPTSSSYMAIDDIYLTDEWCNMPTDVTATATVNEITVSWNANGGSSFTVFVGNDTITEVSDTTYTFTNLNGNTQYNYGVATECTDGNSMFAGGSIRTLCTLLDTLPYSYGFEGMTTGSSTVRPVIPCWHHLNNGTQYFGYPYVSSTNHTGTRSLYWYNTTTTGTYGDYEMVVLPGVDTTIYPINTLQLTFWARPSSTSYYPVFKVGVMTDPNDATTFQEVATVNVANSTTWQVFTVSLGAYTGAGNFVAVRMDRSGSSYYAYTDDFTLETLPTCPSITDLEATPTVGAAMLTWGYMAGYDAPANYVVTYDSIGGTSPVTVNVTDPSVVITGLEAHTTYKVYVRADCGSEGMGANDSITFTTGHFDCMGRSEITMGNSTTGISGCLAYSSWGNTAYQTVWTASELTAAGVTAGPITAIDLGFTASTYAKEFTIFLKNSTTTSMSDATLEAPGTKVYGPAAHPIGTEGWQHYEFDTTFVWDGTSSIVMTTFMNQPTGTSQSSSSGLTGYYLSASNKARYRYQDNTQWTTSNLTSGNSGSTYSYRAAAHFYVGACTGMAICANPAVMVTDKTANSVTLAWVPGANETSWDIEYHALDTNTWTTAATAVSGNTFTVTSLASGTDYEFRVSFQCDDGTSTVYAGTVTTRTPCTEISIPYSYGFEDLSTGTSSTHPDIPCWRHLNNGTSYPGYPYVSSTAHNGNRSLYWYLTTTTGTYGDYEIVVLPPVDTTINPINTLQLTFWAKPTSTSYSPVFLVGVMTDPDNVSTFQTVSTVNVSNLSTDWMQYEVSLHGYTGEGRYVAVRANRPSSSWYAYTDDFTLDVIPTCPHVVDIHTSMNTGDSIMLTWTPVGTEAEWLVTLGDTSFVTTEDSLLITDLSPSTHYYGTVTSVCSTEDSSVAYPFHVFTACGALTTLPYVQDFENEATTSSSNNNFVPCWHKLNNSTSNYYPYLSASTTYNHTPNGGKGLYWGASTTTGTYGDYYIIVLPEVDTMALPINTLKLSFWAKSSSTSYYPVFYVGVMTDPTVDTTFQYYDTITLGNNTEWERYTTVFSDWVGNGNYIAIRGNRPSSAWYAYMDDIILDVMPACPAVEDVAVQAGTTSAIVTWNTFGNSVTGADVEYKTDDENTWTTVTVSGNNYAVLTGLTAGTTYQLRVSSVCSDGEASPVSSWFTTRSFACEVFDTLNMVTFSDTIGNGTVTNTYFPSYSFYNYGLTQQIFTPDELGHASTINNIAFKMSAVAQQRTYEIYMGHTTEATASQFLNPSDLTMVYNGGPVNLVANQWTNFTLTTPFNYNGTDNLVVFFRDMTGSYVSGNAAYGTTGAEGVSRYIYQDGGAYTVGSTSGGTMSNFRNNLVFGGIAAACLQQSTCAAPVAYMTGTTTTTANVVWGPGNTETAWNVYYRLAGDANFTLAAANVTTHSYTFTGLASGMHYEFKVEAVCSTPGLSSIVDGITECATLTLPFTENFNGWGTGTGTLPNCWYRTGCYSSYSYISGSYNRSGSAGGSIYMYQSGTYHSTIFLPAIDTNVIQANQTQLVFHVMNTSASYLHAGFEVGVLTDPDDISTFVPVDTVYHSVGPNVWQGFEVSLAGYTGNGAYIGLRTTDNPASGTEYTYTYPYLDDFTLELIPTCPRPDTLYATNATTSSVDLGWHDRAGASQWVIEYGPLGFELGTGTQVVANTNPYTLTGLPAAYQGEFYVKAVCGPGDTGDYSRMPFGFNTSQIPATIPYNYDFEDPAEWANWQTSSNSATNTWYRGTAVADSGSYSIYMSADNGATYRPYSYNAVVNAAAYRDIDFGTIDSSFTISFRARVGGTISANYDGLMVFLVDPSLSTVPSNNNITSPWGNVNDLYRIATVRRDTTWQTYEASFDTIHGIHRVAFFWFNQNTQSSDPNLIEPAAVDNIHIDYSTCPRPLNLEAVATTGNTATLTWDGAPSATYQVVYRQDGSNNHVAITNTNSIVLTGLNSAATHYAWVRKLCGVGDTSLYSDGISFETQLCDGAVVASTGEPTGTAYYTPVNNFYHYTLTETIIDSAELVGMSNITTIAYDYAYATASTVKTDVTIWLQPTNKTSFSSSSDIVALDTTIAVQVYQGNLNCQQGWNFFAFTTPFVWDGHSNVLVIVDDNSDDYDGSAYVFNTVSSTDYKTIHYYSDSYNPDPLTPSSFSGSKGYLQYRVHMQLISCGGAACMDPIIDTFYAGENTVTLNWTGNASSYQVAAVVGAWVEPTTTNTSLSNTATLTGLTPNTQYSVGVRAVCGEGVYSEWTVVDVTTLVHPCYTPTNVVASNITFNGASIDWVPGEETQNNFELRYSTGGDTVTVTTAIHPYTLSGLANSTEYSVAVRAVCGEGDYSDWSAPATFTTATCQPVSGVNVAGITATSATVTWTGSASGYQIEYGYTGFTQGNGTRVDVTGTSYTINGLEPETSYDVYVRAVCGENNYSGWSNATPFETQAGSGTYYTLTLNVNDPSMGSVSGAGTYEAGTSVTVTATSNAGYHFVKWSDNVNDSVRTVVMNSNISLTATFAANGTQGIDDVEGNAISLYPNPASSTVTLTGIEGAAKVTVVDMNGREVYSANAAEGRMTIDVSGMAQGAYFVRITGERVNAIRKLIVR